MLCASCLSLPPPLCWGGGGACVHGFNRFILQGRYMGWAVMACDCLSDKPLRSSDGGRLADWKDWRTELCVAGLSRKLTIQILFERGVSASRSFYLFLKMHETCAVALAS